MTCGTGLNPASISLPRVMWYEARASGLNGKPETTQGGAAKATDDIRARAARSKRIAAILRG